MPEPESSLDDRRPPRKGQFRIKGEAVERLLRTSRKSKADFAKIAKISQSNLERWLKSENAYYSSIVAFADALRIQPTTIAHAFPECLEDLPAIPLGHTAILIIWHTPPRNTDTPYGLKAMIEGVCRLTGIDEVVIQVNDSWTGSLAVELVGPDAEIQKLLQAFAQGRLGAYTPDSVAVIYGLVARDSAAANLSSGDDYRRQLAARLSESVQQLAWLGGRVRGATASLERGDDRAAAETILASAAAMSRMVSELLTSAQMLGPVPDSSGAAGNETTGGTAGTVEVPRPGR